MSRYRTIRMVVAGAAVALAGCVATTPDRGEQAAPAAAESGSTTETVAQTVFEATGIAYLGGETTFSQVRRHAYHESKRRLFDAGATIHLSAVQATTFGELTTDCAMQVAGGTLLDFKVLDEGIENEARYFVRSKARFERREAEKALGKEALKQIGCWTGEEEPAVDVVKTPEPDVPKVTTTEGSATVKSDNRTSSGSGTSVSTSGAGTQVAESRASKSGTETKTTVVIESVPPADTTVCCHEFPKPLSRKVYPVLEQTEGVTRLQELDTADGSLCYRFHYDGPLAPLEERLKADIRTSSVLAFKIRRDRGPRIIDLVFDSGYD